MSLRDEMPATAAAIDQLREVFGADLVNDAIRRTVRGEAGGIYAVEGDKTFGAPARLRGNWVSLKDIQPVPKKDEEDGNRTGR